MRIMVRALAAVLLFLTGMTGVAFAHGAHGDVPTGKLPDGVTPHHYRLDLALDPDMDGFTGTVVITVELASPQETVWLHGKDLRVSSVTATPATGGAPVQGRWEQVEKDGVARITFPEPLAAGRHDLTIAYSADYDRRLRGIYKTTEDGRSYLFSQFQAISARLAWPGFDEPRFKTPFDIILTVKEGHEAVTTTPLAAEETLPDGRRRLTFQRTKPLPTYLLAFAVGPLDIVEWEALPANEVRDHPVPLRGVTVRGKGDRIRTALADTAGMFAEIERYFGIPYPYEKLDLIAAPDFGAGAMENVGAIIYREQRILVDESTPLQDRRSYAITHAHELAHMWFGNLVTPAWWDDIWLNESFATWMSIKAVSAWRPTEEFGRETQRLAIEAMSVDSLENTRQIRQPVAGVHEISNAFDWITYRKGGGVLSMMEAYVGEEMFRKAIRYHLTRHAHGVATSDDFFQSIADTVGDSRIVAALRSMVDQPGLPLIYMDVACTSPEKAEVTLRQERYRPVGSGIRQGQSWSLPVCLRPGPSDADVICVLMDKPQMKVDLSVDTCPTALVPNVNGAGYYRADLAGRSQEELLKLLPALPPAEQIAALDSLWGGLNAGRAEMPDFLAAVRALASSGDWDVATAALPALDIILDTVIDPADRPFLEEQLAGLYRPALDRIGLLPGGAADRERPQNTALLRGRLVSFLAFEARDPSVRAELLKLARIYTGFGGTEADPSAVPPDLAGSALGVAAQELGKPFAEHLKGILATSTDAILREQALDALNGITDPELSAEVRQLVFWEKLRTNEVRRLLERHGGEPANRDPMWDWVKANLPALQERLGQPGLRTIVQAVDDGCTAERRDEVEALFAPVVADIPGGPRALAQALERISLCAALVKAQRPAIGALPKIN